MATIRKILAPTCGKTATFRLKLSERLLWSDFYSRIAAVAELHFAELDARKRSFNVKAQRTAKPSARAKG